MQNRQVFLNQDSHIWQHWIICSSKQNPVISLFFRFYLSSFSSWQFIHIYTLRIGLVPGNVVMVAIDMYGKSLREWIYGVTWTHYFIIFVIIQTLKFFTLFIFHYFLFILMFPFYLQATSAFYKPITIFFCIIKGDGITSRMEGYFSVSLFSILLYHTGL